MIHRRLSVPLGRLINGQRNAVPELRERAAVVQPHAVATEGPAAAQAAAVLTRPGGPLPVDDAVRGLCAIVEEGDTLRFLVHRSHQFNAKVLSVADQARRVLRRDVGKAEPVDQSELRDLYGAAITGELANGTSIRNRLWGLLVRAVAVRANDIQFRLYETTARAQFQINGFLTDTVDEFTLEEATAFLTTAFHYCDQGDTLRVPGIAQRTTVTNRKKLPDELFAVRMHFSEVGAGQHLNIRLIYESLPLPGTGIKALRLPPQDAAKLYYIQNMAAGLFTVVAPPEHGKSTTLTYWLTDLAEANENRLTIVSVDDPPEGLDPRIIYFPVSGEVTDDYDPYDGAMRACLRVSPHVIRVGECRTKRAAVMCFHAANTGKPVATTIHTEEGLDTPSRYVEMGVPRDLAYNHRRHAAWMAQRLVPTLCPECRRRIGDVLADNAARLSELAEDPKRKAEHDLLEEAHTRLLSLVTPYRELIGAEVDEWFMRGTGCSGCQKDKVDSIPGISGRQLIVEIIHPTASLCALLKEERMREARAQWLTGEPGQSMRLKGLAHMRAGLIGLAEYAKFVAPAENLAEDLAIESVPHPMAAE